MRKRGILIPGMFALLLLGLVGCQDQESEQTGRIVVKITDAPFPIEMIFQASVTITRVELRNAGKDSTGDPFITIFEDTAIFNLLELRNGVTAELVDTEIPYGNYDLIRIYIDQASISVKEHDSYMVKVPSGQSTGIKVFIKPALRVEGELTEVLLDFNLDRSFVLKGNMNTPAGIKGFNFKPVIRAINNATAGVVRGSVWDVDSLPVPDAMVWIETDTIFNTSFTGLDGSYVMPGIPAGIYTLSAVKEGFDTVSYYPVEIVEGNTITRDFILPASEE